MLLVVKLNEKLYFEFRPNQMHVRKILNNMKNTTKNFKMKIFFTTEKSIWK